MFSLWALFGFALIKTFDFPRPFCVLSYLHNAVASVFAHTLSTLPLDPILLSGTKSHIYSITGSRKHLFICASNSQFLIVFVSLVTKLNGTGAFCPNSKFSISLVIF